jgi:adenylate cyclase
MTSGDHTHHWQETLRRLVPERLVLRRGQPQPGPAPESGTLPERVERLLLRGPRLYTRRQVHELTGMPDTRTRRLWRSLGFADVPDDDVVFTDADMDALDQLELLRLTGVVPTEVQEAVIRSMALSMAGLAEWLVGWIYHQTGAEQLAGDPDRALQAAAEALPLMDSLLSHAWRRQLVAAGRRLRAVRADDPNSNTAVVGSADLVGFTRTTRSMAPDRLVEMVELFHAIAAEVAARHGGRIVKTIGDEVQFIADRPEHAAELALELLDRTSGAGLPELRIGMALGPVLHRFGDVYGDVVHTATLLGSQAPPGRVLVEQAMATALEPDPRFTLRLRRPISVPGYPSTQAWGLRSADPSTD